MMEPVEEQISELEEQMHNGYMNSPKGSRRDRGRPSDVSEGDKHASIR